MPALALAAAGTTAKARLVVRRNLATLGADDPALRALRLAAGRARRAAGSPPAGWAGFVAQHAAICGSGGAGGGHGGALVLPWHRAYLHLVEAWLQRLAGDRRIALPYWDWTRDRRIPAAFTRAGDPLADPTRRAGRDDELPADLADAGPALRARSLEALAGSPRPDDSDFSALGLLAATAAGNVRNWAGGNLGDCSGAASDVLYLAHCANVDRLWEAWRDADPARAAVPEPFRGVSVTLRDSERAAKRFAMAALADPARLGYRYDDLRVEAAPRDEPSAGGARHAVLRFSRAQLPGLPATFRVFLNNRNALPATRPEGSTYASTCTIFPEDADAEVAVPLEVSAEMGQRIAVQAGVSVTLVLVPLPGRPPAPRPIWVSDPELTLPAA